jgi:hypothetical protein
MSEPPLFQWIFTAWYRPYSFLGKLSASGPEPAAVLVQKSRPWNIATKGTGTNKQ